MVFALNFQVSSGSITVFLRDLLRKNRNNSYDLQLMKITCVAPCFLHVFVELSRTSIKKTRASCRSSAGCRHLKVTSIPVPGAANATSCTSKSEQLERVIQCAIPFSATILNFHSIHNWCHILIGPP